jgi:hypothetical protein
VATAVATLHAMTGNDGPQRSADGVAHSATHAAADFVLADGKGSLLTATKLRKTHVQHVDLIRFLGSHPGLYENAKWAIRQLHGICPSRRSCSQ